VYRSLLEISSILTWRYSGSANTPLRRFNFAGAQASHASWTFVPGRVHRWFNDKPIIN
jgi:hypothetical protein